MYPIMKKILLLLAAVASLGSVNAQSLQAVHDMNDGEFMQFLVSIEQNHILDAADVARYKLTTGKKAFKRSDIGKFVNALTPLGEEWAAINGGLETTTEFLRQETARRVAPTAYKN
jgi:hypothetical protein